MGHLFLVFGVVGRHSPKDKAGAVDLSTDSGHGERFSAKFGQTDPMIFFQVMDPKPPLDHTYLFIMSTDSHIICFFWLAVAVGHRWSLLFIVDPATVFVDIYNM